MKKTQKLKNAQNQNDDLPILDGDWIEEMIYPPELAIEPDTTERQLERLRAHFKALPGEIRKKKAALCKKYEKRPTEQSKQVAQFYNLVLLGAGKMLDDELAIKDRDVAISCMGMLPRVALQLVGLALREGADADYAVVLLRRFNQRVVDGAEAFAEDLAEAEQKLAWDKRTLETCREMAVSMVSGVSLVASDAINKALPQPSYKQRGFKIDSLTSAEPLVKEWAQKLAAIQGSGGKTAADEEPGFTIGIEEALAQLDQANEERLAFQEKTASAALTAAACIPPANKNAEVFYEAAAKYVSGLVVMDPHAVTKMISANGNLCFNDDGCPGAPSAFEVCFKRVCQRMEQEIAAVKEEGSVEEERILIEELFNIDVVFSIGFNGVNLPKSGVSLVDQANEAFCKHWDMLNAVDPQLAQQKAQQIEATCKEKREQSIASGRKIHPSVEEGISKLLSLASSLPEAANRASVVTTSDAARKRILTLGAWTPPANGLAN